MAADGGADGAQGLGVRPDYVVGDMDSVRPATLRRLDPRRVRRDADPDHTDLEKALAFCEASQVTDVTVVGATGGRLDHTLAALAAVGAASERLRIRLVDDLFLITPVRRRHVGEGAPGTLVSLLAPSGAQGVSTRGLRFPLKDADLPFSPLGVHNEIVRGSYSVRIRSGLLFVLEAHRRVR